MTDETLATYKRCVDTANARKSAVARYEKLITGMASGVRHGGLVVMLEGANFPFSPYDQMLEFDDEDHHQLTEMLIPILERYCREMIAKHQAAFDNLTVNQ
jgi:hypothetical protein